MRTRIPTRKEVDAAVDAAVELHLAEGKLLEVMQRLPDKKVASLPWSVRRELKHVKRIHAKAKATPGWPRF